MGISLISVNTHAKLVSSEVIYNVPYPSYLKYINTNEVSTKTIAMSAEGCDSQGKVNQYTVACGYFNYHFFNGWHESKRYIVNKFICVDEKVCTYWHEEYVVEALQSITIPKHRLDWTVKASKPGNYEVEAYLIVDGAEKQNATSS